MAVEGAAGGGGGGTFKVLPPLAAAALEWVCGGRYDVELAHLRKEEVGLVVRAARIGKD